MTGDLGNGGRWKLLPTHWRILMCILAGTRTSGRPGHCQRPAPSKGSPLQPAPPGWPTRPPSPRGSQQTEGADGRQHHPTQLIATGPPQGSLKSLPLPPSWFPSPAPSLSGNFFSSSTPSYILSLPTSPPSPPPCSPPPGARATRPATSALNRTGASRSSSSRCPSQSSHTQMFIRLGGYTQLCWKTQSLAICLKMYKSFTSAPLIPCFL